MSVTNNTSRPKTSSMEEIIVWLLWFLDIDSETDEKDSVFLSYPHFSCRFWSGKSGTLKDLVGNPEELQAAKSKLCRQLRNCASPVEVFQFFNIRSLFFFLSRLERWMSVDDMSAAFRYVWQTGIAAPRILVKCA